MESLLAQGRCAEVLDLEGTIVTRDPQTLLLRGLALAELKRPSEALESFDECWSLAHRLDDPLTAARLLRELGLDLEALAFARRALLLQPTSSGALTLVGQLLVGLDDSLALRRLEQSLAVDAQQAAAWLTVSELHLSKGNAVEALRSAQRALDLAPSWTEAQAVFHRASVASIPLTERLFTLTPFAISLACSFAAFNDGFTGPRFWLLIGASCVFTGLAMFLGWLLRRRRWRALGVHDAALLRFEQHVGAGGTRSDDLVPPSEAALTHGVGTFLYGAAAFFALVGLALLAFIVWDLEQHPFQLVMVLLGMLPFVVMGLLFVEARKARRLAARARKDRS
ncbi:MAG: hypothetical protein MUC96_21715 [Myxococcaceae bacterium]|jgi:tetratricopeptide (TPR) repeat protein|nr:hypothetical protein [Myxococcaceae bacterium]